MPNQRHDKPGVTPTPTPTPTATAIQVTAKKGHSGHLVADNGKLLKALLRPTRIAVHRMPQDSRQANTTTTKTATQQQQWLLAYNMNTLKSA